MTLLDIDPAKEEKEESEEENEEEEEKEVKEAWKTWDESEKGFQLQVAGYLLRKSTAKGNFTKPKKRQKK